MFVFRLFGVFIGEVFFFSFLFGSCVIVVYGGCFVYVFNFVFLFIIIVEYNENIIINVK